MRRYLTGSVFLHDCFYERAQETASDNIGRPTQKPRISLRPSGDNLPLAVSARIGARRPGPELAEVIRAQKTTVM